MTKDFLFHSQKTLNLRGKINHLSSPMVMGIMNLSADSFYDGGKLNNNLQALRHAEMLLKQGAHILDIGAASSRPGAAIIPAQVEILKIKPVVNSILRHFPDAIISIDTYNAQTAAMAAHEGAHIVNDISAGQIDPQMFETVARLKMPYVLTHMKGLPQTMQNNPVYDDVVKEISLFFAQKIEVLNKLGIYDIILDPGFGFGKSLEQNYMLLNQLDFFKIFELPILVGISRKSMIYKALDTTPEEALNGTTALHTIALLKGASILRVHDVKEALEVVSLVKLITANEQKK